MASFNKITIVGYLGRDCVIRYTPKGEAMCQFSVATTERKRKHPQVDEYEDITTWFQVTAWGRLVENTSPYLTKGKQVFIEGRLRREEYTDREGVKHVTLQVTAFDVQLLGPKDKKSESEIGPTYTDGDITKSQSTNNISELEQKDFADDSEVPF